MAEELYFFKLDAEKARTELIKQLELDDQFSFQKNIKNYSDEELRFEEVIEKIKANIELLSVEEFWSIWNLLTERITAGNSNASYKDQWNSFVKTMSVSGMDLFYEITSKTQVRKFHSILWDYECHMETDIMYPLVEKVCNCSDFNNFLKYGICFTGELFIFLSNYYKDRLKEILKFQNEIEDINLKYGTDYHEMALVELEKQSAYNLETIGLIPTLQEFRRSTAHLSSVSYPTEMSEISNRESELLTVADRFYDFINLMSMTENYSGKILMLHSY